MSDMASRLTEARKQAGYSSARKAALAFGWKYTTYAGHENGSRGFDDDVRTYAQRFNVSLEWLMTGKGPMKRSGESAEIVEIYQRIPAKHRASALRMLEGLAEPKKRG
jgi:phage repressor protein C with HTH and peptisase S24 domain